MSIYVPAEIALGLKLHSVWKIRIQCVGVLVVEVWGSAGLKFCGWLRTGRGCGRSAAPPKRAGRRCRS